MVLTISGSSVASKEMPEEIVYTRNCTFMNQVTPLNTSDKLRKC